MRRRLVIPMVVAMIVSMAVLGCDQGVEHKTATTTTDAIPATTSGGGSDVVHLVRDYADSQPVDTSAIVNLANAGLTDAQKEVLARQSFVAVVKDPLNGPWKFWHVYETARYQGLPALVTTDSLLNAYHGLFDTLLQRMEEAALYDQAVAMTDALHAAASQQWDSATDPAIKEAARLNMAFFSVAGSLLQADRVTPAVVAGEVDAEVALINAAAGVDESPILGYTEDYSQYKPRGHYARSETLERYFRAMMWYGHTGFFINPRSPDVTDEEAFSLTQRAILVASSLVGEAKEAWTAIYEPTSFLVGRADDLTVDDMETVITEVFGTSRPEPDALADAEKIAAVRTALNELPAPKILSATTREPGDTQDREANERSFRVMGQRYIPDSYAFQQLVWAYVGDEANKRDLPMGLDVMTVLGSDQAYTLEKENFGQDQYANWESQIARVSEDFATRNDGLWPAGLYTGWLEALQKVMAPPADGAPAFMHSRVWARKSLNAALGSWTELRHDTILYAKQSVTAEGDGGEEPETAGYVEPYPDVYTKIAELATTMREVMDQYDLTDSEAAGKLDTMIELAQNLATIAQKELEGRALTTMERTVIARYGNSLEELEHFSTSDQGMTLSPGAERSPLVADVHTSYNTQRALEEATGYPLVLYAAFESDGKLRLFCGASYAYYEFTAPLEGRLTDEAWTELLDAGQAPPRPGWTDEWIVGR